MSRSLLMMLVMATAAPTTAQPSDAPARLPVFFESGSIGFSYLESVRADNVLGLDLSFNVHYRRHALGARVRTHKQFLPLDSPGRVTEVGGIYSFSPIRNVSVGAGMFYVNERYIVEGEFDFERNTAASLRSTRLGIPLEVTLRARPLPLWSPYVRGTLTLSEAPAHGGIALGVSF